MRMSRVQWTPGVGCDVLGGSGDVAIGGEEPDGVNG